MIHTLYWEKEMHIYLKIKAKELGAEAKFNKQEQQKCLKKARKARHLSKDRTETYHMAQAHGMYEHLRDVVAPHARGTNIARGFLNGKSYKEIERWTYKPLGPYMDDDVFEKRKFDPNTWNYVYDMIIKYGEANPKHNQTIQERWDVWYAEAQEWLRQWDIMDSDSRKLYIREHCPLKPKVPYKVKKELETVLDMH
jgi:hypothetical protein